MNPTSVPTGPIGPGLRLRRCLRLLLLCCCLNFAAPATAVSVAAGWNLLGNPALTALDVASVFGDATRVLTVWKWQPATGDSAAGWAFYAPALPDGGKAWAASRGYRSLASIAPGEGFWVNARVGFELALPAALPVLSRDFQAAGRLPLTTGWNLLAVGDQPTPREFAQNLADAPVTSLWAWNPAGEATPPGWFFYAPSLDAVGALAGYASSKGYLDFASQGRRLVTGSGFWANVVRGNGLATPGIPAGQATSPIAALQDGLVAYWPLDGDWRDALGRYDLTPTMAGGFSADGYPRTGANQVYGPTGSNSGNGASNLNLTTLPEERGITLAGWTMLPDDGTGGVLFGFPAADWNQPNLTVSIGWGFIWVSLGGAGSGAVVQYPRIGDTCWHHLALVLPAGFRDGVPFRFYLDGQEVAPVVIDLSVTGGTTLGPGASLWGRPFQAGAFVLPGGGSNGARDMKLDEVGLWARELSASEVAGLAGNHGAGKACQNTALPDWAPGPRSVPPETPPTPMPTLGVHVLTDDTLAVITDPNPWLKERIRVDSGAYLTAMEGVGDQLPGWLFHGNYQLAAKEAILRYRPGMLAALANPGHLSVTDSSGGAVPIATTNLWPQATREFRVPRVSPGSGEFHLTAAEVVYYSFVKLAQPLRSGTSYRIADAWGNRVDFTYDDSRTVSWAMKVNQIGYPALGGEKIGYLGGWLGPAGGALDLRRFDVAAGTAAKTFNLRRDSDHGIVYTGPVNFRSDESQPVPLPDNGGSVRLSGERVYEMDFSAFSTPGRYYLQVPGVGRSWSFDIGPYALGEAFYTHMRGLYHQRCAPLDPARTPWARGDLHHPIKKALHPTELDAYGDNTAQGWGFTDASGNYPAGGMDPFKVIAATRSDTIASPTSGEWHDAADFSIDGMGHMRVLEYLSLGYLLFPQNFSDDQLNIPESGNGLPDILDEAVWGANLWRRLQEPDGRVALYVEADSHPMIADAGQDTQPYYQGLATRNSSLHYAEHAARLARALKAAGAVEQADSFLASARRAYGFGMTDFATVPRISATFSYGGQDITWREPAVQDSQRRLKALMQLWLASGDAQFFAAMDTAEMTEAFRVMVDYLYWPNSALTVIDVALAPEKFPAGWGTLARNGIIATADQWLGWQARNAYRNLWFPPGVGYFTLMGWGNNGFGPALHLIAAWRLTGDDRYRSSAGHMVNWMTGANPQGRSLTTGLGSNYVVHPLHLPADVDGIADPVPGITVYGYTQGIPFDARTSVYGLFDEAIPGMNFEGSALAQLPPPWNDTGMSFDQVGQRLYAEMALWRNLVNLEAANVPQTEFTVGETIGPAALVTGALLAPGWKPPASLVNRRPKSAAELQDMLWYQP